MAFALSDVLIAEDAPAAEPMRARAEALGKRIVQPGAGLPCPPATGASIAAKLDPTLSGWHSRYRTIYGRLDQALLELFAWNWTDEPGKRSGGWLALRRCFRRQWGASAYYGPELPHGGSAYALDPAAPILTLFECFDRERVTRRLHPPRPDLAAARSRGCSGNRGPSAGS